MCIRDRFTVPRCIKINANPQRREEAKSHSQPLFASLRLRGFALNLSIVALGSDGQTVDPKFHEEPAYININALARNY